MTSVTSTITGMGGMMGIDTYGSYGVIDTSSENEEASVHRRRLIAEDAAKRPWLIGKALRDFRYTWFSRVRVVARDTWDAALWSWRMSR
jgi:hypothetical protein